MNNKETRSFNFEARTEETESGKGRVIGVPIVFNTWADLGIYEECIGAGALNGTDLKDVRFLVNHDTKMIPLARSRNNNANSTMELTPIETGLQMRTDLDIENNSTAKELYSAMGRGDIDQMSFMFTVDGDKWDGLETDKPRRTITSIGKIFEVSAVTFPAYESTFIGVRDKEALESAKTVLENAKRSLERDRRSRELKEEIKTMLGEI